MLYTKMTVVRTTEGSFEVNARTLADRLREYFPAGSGLAKVEMVANDGIIVRILTPEGKETENLVTFSK